MTSATLDTRPMTRAPSRLGTILLAPMRLPVWGHALAAAASFGLFNWVQTRLDASYAASSHPVDYATGQLSFSASQVESWYAAMQDSGTLGVYWQTQFIDFGFIAAVMAMGLLVGTLAARLARPGSWARLMGLAAAAMAIAGAGFDAVENLLSFVMLTTPQAIPQSLAVIYSSAAAVKFALLVMAVLTFFATLPLATWSRLRG